MAIYLFSIVGAYFEIRRSYNEEAKNSKPNIIDFIMLFIPLINTFMAVLYLLNKENSNNLLVRFFGLKR